MITGLSVAAVFWASFGSPPPHIFLSTFIKKMKRLSIKQISSLLIVYPHPDDEAFFGAGLIAKLTAKGIRVSAICLTKGEASTLRFHVKAEEELAAVRASEYRKSMQILGVTDYEQYDFGDGNLAEPQIRSVIEQKIKEFSPSHILTFEPYGIYGHPDHITTSSVVAEIASKQNIELIYATLHRHPRVINGNTSVRPLAPNSYLLLGLTGSLKKLRCLSAHRSQVKLNFAFFWKWSFRNNLLVEYYCLKQNSPAC